MAGSTDSWDNSEISISSTSGGEIQLDTKGNSDELADVLDKLAPLSKLLREINKGNFDKLRREAKEIKKQSGQPVKRPTPPKPIETTTNPPPEKSIPPQQEDSPERQGAPELSTIPEDVIVLKTEEPSPDPVVSSEEPSFSAFDQSNPLPVEQIAHKVLPPSVPDADFAAFVQRILRNEPEPGQKHPTHSVAASRKPAADADPVDLFTGVFTIQVVDLIVPTGYIPVALSRSYRSGKPYYGPFGYGWDHEYNVYLRELTDGNVAFWTGQLQERQFRAVAGGFEPEPGMACRLEHFFGIAHRYRIHFPEGRVWDFERPAGWSDAERIPLTLISDRHGNTVQLRYNSKNQLSSVLDDGSRGLLFQYGSCELLEQVTDHTGTRAVHYWHDNEIEHLVRVVLPATSQYPQGLFTTYEYDSYANHPAMRHNILRIHDAANRLMVENEYAGPEGGWEFNAVVRQRLAGFEYRFEYQQIQYVWPDPQYVDVLATRTLVRRPDGSLHTYTFNYRGDLLDYRFRLIRDGSLRVIATQREYDDHGNLTKLVEPDGIRKFFTYDTTNPNPCAWRNLLRVELAAPLSNIVPSRVVYRATYEPRYQLIKTTKDETDAETRFFYDIDASPTGTGRLTRLQLPLVFDTDGVAQQSEYEYQYNTRGKTTAFTKPEGGRTEFTYGSGGLLDGFLLTITNDPTGIKLTTTFEYDAVGFLKAVEAPGVRRTEFTHNALGQVEKTEAREVNGQRATLRRWIDDSGSVVRQERPAGSSAATLLSGTSIVDECERDETGNIHSITLAANSDIPRTWLLRNDHEGRPSSIWDPTGMRVDKCYGENGVLLRETVAAGESYAETTRYVYDHAARLTRMESPWRDKTEFHYDLWGRLDRQIEPGGAITMLTLGENNRIQERRVEETDPFGVAPNRLLRHQTYEYDKRGRLIATSISSFRNTLVAAVKLRTRYYYDKDDKLRKIVLPHGAQIQYDFDRVGRIDRTLDYFGNEQQFTYDASGDLSTITTVKMEDGLPITINYVNTYDARGRLIKTEYPDRITTVSYDDRGLPIEQGFPTKISEHLHYNVFDQVVERVVDPNGLALRSRFDYDSRGQLYRFTDPMSQVTTWERDAFGRTVAVKLPDGTLWGYRADINKRTIEQQMPSGNRVLFEFEKNMGYPTKMTCTGVLGQEAVAPHLFTYDGLGQLLSASNGTDTILRNYDSLGRLVAETARGETVLTEYDDIARTVDLLFPDGRRERQHFNNTGQPTQTTLAMPGTLGGTPGEVLLEIFYSSAGRPVSMVYGNGIEGQLVYDDQGRIIRVEYRKSGALLDSCRLLFDEKGHRAVIQYLGLPEQNLEHRFDGNERLTEVRQGFQLAPLGDVKSSVAQITAIATVRSVSGIEPDISFILDEADTRIKAVGLNAAGGTEVYVSTNDHRIVAVGSDAITYNQDGFRTGDGNYLYELDALNRIRRVRDRATNSLVAELQYDALSRIATGATNGQGYERWFAGATRIQETTGVGPSATRQFTKHPFWPVPLSVTGTTGPLYVHQDEGWSTMCVTDEAGTVLERNRYGVFGSSAVFAADGVTALASNQVEPCWRGLPELGNTGLFCTPRRVYDSRTGVFTSRDPLLYYDSPSPYAYAAHNPVDFADPTGLAKTPLGNTSPPAKPAAPDWTTQTEWGFSDPDLVEVIPMVRSFDTGNRPLNFVLNKVILPWRNLLAFYENIVFTDMIIIDKALERALGVNDYQMLKDMLPFMKTWGLAMEVGPALVYFSEWLAATRNAESVAPIVGKLKGIAMAPALWMMGAFGLEGESSTAQSVAAAIETPKPAILLPETSGMGFNTFEELKDYLGNFPGFQWHHIVEQNAVNLAKFGPHRIHNTNNVRLLSYMQHRPISGFYSSQIPGGLAGGPRYRDIVSTWSFEAQHDFGLQVMKQLLEDF